jgi:hypothetical protein
MDLLKDRAVESVKPDEDFDPLPSEIMVESLPVPERFVLWAVRRWVDDVRQGTRDSPHLADGFAAAQLTDALPDFLIMMEAIAGGVRRPLEVRCLPCNRVSPDEAILFDAVRCGQAHDCASLFRLLGVVLKPAATRIAGIRGYAFAVAMVGANFPLMPAAWHPAAGHTLH